jgi:CMP-2-keto-3-deoxyoctulosonic acid synthetase
VSWGASRAWSTSTRPPTSLGSAAVKHPTFDFGSATRSQSAFTATAIKLEDTGVMAYQGQAPFIKSQDVFKAAISIHPVEARHAAWIRQIAHQSPAPVAFNPALTKDQVLAAVTATGFIKG